MSKQKKGPEVIHPDDLFFRKIMDNKENARAYLESFYPDIANKIDLDTLELQPLTFINPKLKVFHSDI